jgi:hypothetical protein
MSEQNFWICGGERSLYASSMCLREVYKDFGNQKYCFLLALITVRDDLCDVSASWRGGPRPAPTRAQSRAPSPCNGQEQDGVLWARARGQGIQRSWGAASLVWARLVSWVAGCWKENKRNRKRPQALLCVQDT